MDRKSFFRTAGRGVLLGAMGLMVLGFAGRDKLSNTNTCSDSRFCSKCDRLGTCNKDAALKARRDEKR